MKEIRKLIAIKEGKFDVNYTLVRTATGAIYLETFESPNKPFEKGAVAPPFTQTNLMLMSSMVDPFAISSKMPSVG